MTTVLPSIDHEVDQAMNQLVGDLRAARDTIAEFGMYKERYGMSAGGPACILGAILRPMGLTPDDVSQPRVTRAAYALNQTLGLDVTRASAMRHNLYNFNDESFTTEADVLALFDMTIKNLSDR